MLASMIRRNMLINHEGLTLRVRDIGTDKRGRVRMITDAGTIRVRPDIHVKALAEMTSGPVQSRQFARTPRQVRVSNGAWVGERDGTTQERIISYSRGWDL